MLKHNENEVKKERCSAFVLCLLCHIRHSHWCDKTKIFCDFWKKGAQSIRTNQKIRIGVDLISRNSAEHNTQPLKDHSGSSILSERNNQIFVAS